MAILAANCPCCGRDIGFDENAREYTCIFCGAKLITATLVKEKLDPNANAGYERYRKGDITDSWGRGKRADQPRQSGAAEAAPSSGEKKPAAETVKKEEKPAEKPAEPELTEEEIRVQLMRKAEFKQELRDVVKEIDTLRSRRTRYTDQLKLCKYLMIVGLVLVAAAAAIMILLSDNESFEYRFVVAGACAGLGVLTLILSEVKKNGVKKQQKKLETNIDEKKDKRDILIGRLNKINMRLHIHDDHHEEHHEE